MGIHESLIDMAKRRMVIPFIGAGFSANGGLPLWEDLVHLLLEKFKIPSERVLLKHDFLSVIEYMVLRNGGKVGPVRYEIQKLLNDDTVDISRSDPHLLLVGLNPPIIYTTNWDNLIEKAYEYSGREYSRIVTLGDMLDAERKTCTKIIKFHGSLEHEDTLVMTETHYFERLQLESPLDVRLRSDLLGKSLLFLGHSFSDFNIRYLWFKLRKQMSAGNVREVPKSYMVLLEHDNVAIELFSQIGIDSIVLEEFGVGTALDKLCSFLEDLVVEVNRQQIFGSYHREMSSEGEQNAASSYVRQRGEPLVATNHIIDKCFKALVANDTSTAEKYTSILCRSEYPKEQYRLLLQYLRSKGLFALTVSPPPVKQKLLQLLYSWDTKDDEVLFALAMLAFLRIPFARNWEFAQRRPYIKRFLNGQRLNDDFSCTLLNDASLWIEKSRNLKRDASLYYYWAVGLNFDGKADEPFYWHSDPGAVHWITAKKVLEAYKQKLEWLPPLDRLTGRFSDVWRILREANCSHQEEDDLDWEHVVFFEVVSGLANTESLSVPSSEVREYYSRLDETYHKYKNPKRA